MISALDLFCGVGGCSAGYAKAGFGIYAGVDLNPQPNYPYDFYQMDWLEGFNKFKNKVNFIHASPPCQSYSSCNNIFKNSTKPKLVNDVRRELQQWASDGLDRIYVIENVPGCKDMVAPVKVFGSGLGLNTIRERWFESNAFLFGYPKRKLQEKYVFVGTDPGKQFWGDKEGATFEDWKRESGITWAKKPKEIAEAIPPVYTEYLGYQIKSILCN